MLPSTQSRRLKSISKEMPVSNNCSRLSIKHKHPIKATNPEIQDTVSEVKPRRMANQVAKNPKGRNTYRLSGKYLSYSRFEACVLQISLSVGYLGFVTKTPYMPRLLCFHKTILQKSFLRVINGLTSSF